MMRWFIAAAFAAQVILLPNVAGAMVPRERTLYADDFESFATGGVPAGWIPLSGNWLVAQRTSQVLRQADTELTQDSWILTAWANQTTVVKCLAEEGDGAWGIGLLACHDTLGQGYRLRLGEQRLYLEKYSPGQSRVLADTEFGASRGKWYSLRLTVTTEGQSTVLKGRAWSSDAEEPEEWLVSYTDTQSPQRGGTVGLWTGNCAGRFGFLSTRRVNPVDESVGEVLYGSDFSETAQGRLPAFWEPAGGVWVRDKAERTPLLRQMAERSGPDYDDNAAIIVQWTGYTVSVRAMAHPGPGKWGIGLVAYYRQREGNYRLRTLDNQVYLVKRRADGRVVNLAWAPVQLERGRWINMRLAVDNLPGAVRLLGKCWMDDDPEPETWTVSAYDRDRPLRSGAPGLWSFGGAADFDNFLVRTSTLSTLNNLIRANP